MDKQPEKTQEQIMDEKFPAKDYKKMVFPFNSIESRDIFSYDNLIKTAQLMQADSIKLFNMVINNILKRCNVKDSMAIQVLPDLYKQTVIVWEPKLWCSVCNNAKAEYQYNGKYYCPTCIEAVKKQGIKEVKTPEKKEKAKA